ncbi:MAG: prolipoprotein diacylglyceryl transferase [Firmicutes bacterium]|nr:prolipoprotein diacylglyceryl transferase [Bacillota bacterium]
MGEIAFSIGPIAFYWYGLITALAIVAAAGITVWQAKLFFEPVLPIVDLFIFTVPVCIIFARLSFVVMDWELYKNNMVEILRLWHGGMFFGGALIGFAVAFYVYTRIFGLAFWRLADLLAPGVALGQAIGQWANLMNQEAFGFPTALPWGIYIDFLLRPLGYEQFDFFQPLFLYESIWNIGLFIVLMGFSYLMLKIKWLKPKGFLFLGYAFFYAVGHFCFDTFRLDGLATGVVHSSQIICLAVGAVVVVLTVGRIVEAKFR